MRESDVTHSGDPIVHYRFAQECQTAGDFSKAIAQFKHAIWLDPNRLDAEVYAFAAWLLANCPDRSLREGVLAIQYATIACELTDWSEGWTLGILAAALAESGRVAEAVARQEQACTHAFDFDAKMQQHNLALLKAGRSLPFDCYS